MTDKINNYKDLKLQFASDLACIDGVSESAAKALFNKVKNNAKKKRWLPGNLPMLKGNDRNVQCPCGSGKKFKKCCGRIK